MSIRCRDCQTTLTSLIYQGVNNQFDDEEQNVVILDNSLDESYELQHACGACGVNLFFLKVLSTLPHVSSCDKLPKGHHLCLNIKEIYQDVILTQVCPPIPPNPLTTSIYTSWNSRIITPNSSTTSSSAMALTKTGTLLVNAITIHKLLDSF